jgi:hypothetical protein
LRENGGGILDAVWRMLRLWFILESFAFANAYVVVPSYNNAYTYRSGFPPRTNTALCGVRAALQRRLSFLQKAKTTTPPSTSVSTTVPPPSVTATTDTTIPTTTTTTISSSETPNLTAPLSTLQYHAVSGTNVGELQGPETSINIPIDATVSTAFESSLSLATQPVDGGGSNSVHNTETPSFPNRPVSLENIAPPTSSATLPSLILQRPATRVPNVDQPMYQVVPRDETKLTKMELEFRDMLRYFASYSARDLHALREPRTRALFQGVAASANEPAVYRAFEVLYQDILPLRLAGRLIFGKLQGVMHHATEAREREVQAVIQKTNLPYEDVEQVWYVFVSIATQLNHDVYLTREQLSQSGLADIATRVLGYAHVDDLLQNLQLSSDDDKNNEQVRFETLMVGLQRCVDDVCGVERCDPTALLLHMTHQLETLPPGDTVEEHKSDVRKAGYARKYDDMVAAFCSWRDRVPPASPGQPNRRMDVIRGCFVGAENEAVVSALKIVYVDYSALRVAGDLIFGIVSSFMNGQKSRGGGTGRP